MRWSLAPWERAAVLGDLQEEARAIAAEKGLRTARRWYWRQAIVSLWPNVLRRFKGDDRRREAFYASLTNLVLFGLALPVVLGETQPSLVHALYGIGLATSLVSSSAPFFAKRLRPSVLGPGVKRNILRVTGVLIAGAFVAALFARSYPAIIFLAVVGRVVPLLLAPRDSTEPDAYVVSHASLNVPDRDRYLTWRVPNEPAGLSDLVLCRTADAFDVAGPSADAATIQRRFSPEVTLRVCSAVNLTSAPTTVYVEIADSSGRVVGSKPAEIRPEPLTEIPDNWDELADRDAATHFGAVDERVSLGGLPPGSYTLRMTATAGDRGTIRTDQIEITA